MNLLIKSFIGKFFVCCLALLGMHRLIRSTAAKSVLLSSTAMLMTPRHPFKSRYSSSAVTMNAATTTPPSSLVDASNNPLLLQSGLPKFQKIQPSHVIPAIEQQLATFSNDFEEFENLLNNPQEGEAWGKKRIEYDYEMVVEYLEKIQAPISYSWGCIGHLMGVRNSPELRTAHESMQPQVVQVFQKVGQSQALFKALKALKDRKSVWEGLDGPQKRIVDSSIRQMEASGVGLSDMDRPVFNKLQLEAAELSSKFNNNVLDSTKAFNLKLTSADEVEGLPDSAKALAAKQAAANGDEGATAENGPWLITLDMPSYLPAMQHLKSREIREKLYRAFLSRASAGDFDNAPIIKRIMQIKLEMAKMLGYNTYAELSLSKKMAKDVDSVIKLTEMLKDQSLSVAKDELENLKKFASTQGFAGNMELWDVTYWSERLRESKYEFSEEELRPYLPLPKVLDGLFQLAERLFGVTIERADGAEEVWCDDVGFFNIFDATSKEHIASFYLDPYSRPAEKRGGAWMDVCIGKSKVMQRKPVAYLTCNGSPPVGETPSLMTFREVETLFHEFGHGLQHMLTNVEHGEAAGINNVEWDAVELPSQFMENWCYDRKTLYGFAKHHATGEALPEELFEKIKAAKNFHAGMQMMRQLFFGMLDIKLHSEFDPNSDSKTPFDVQKELAKDYTVIPPLEEDRFLCSFGHIFAGGYAAGYYSYKWAEVMSADAFAAFEEAGLDNEKEVAAIGRKFRETVLGKGGGEHPSEVFKSFRGRDPSPEALLRHSGLAMAGK